MPKRNKKLFARAVGRLEQRRADNELVHERRKREVYAKVPELKDIEIELCLQASQIAVVMMRGESLDNLRDGNLALQEKRIRLLTAAGYPEDYLDEICSCPVCRDTGSADGRICQCLQRLYNEEITNSLSSLLKDGSESFDNFDLNLYPDSCRSQMESILGGCLEFVTYFPKVENLLFQGGTGLGKTFLSACIAREIASKGYSVCYDSAISAFDTLSKAEYTSDEQASEKMQDMLDCDLLILDDLGTEAMKPYINSALYNIINTRLINSKPLIISTNLTQSQWEIRYSPAIASRLESAFIEFDFVGNDIRKKLSS